MVIQLLVDECEVLLKPRGGFWTDLGGEG